MRIERVPKKNIPVHHSLFEKNLLQDKSCVSAVLEKLMCIQTNLCICQSGASMPQQISHPASQSRGFCLALNLPDIHAHIHAQRWACYYTLHTHIFFSLSLAHTLTHTQGLGTSRLVALTHFLCFEAASGEMAFPIIAFEACLRRRLCVYTWYGGREVLTLIHCNGSSVAFTLRND